MESLYFRTKWYEVAQVCTTTTTMTTTMTRTKYEDSIEGGYTEPDVYGSSSDIEL